MDVAKAAAREDRLIRADASRMLAGDAAHGARRGGYILADSAVPKVVLIASGDELAIVLLARKRLLGLGVQARVVAMPCPRLFDCQNTAYRNAVLLRNVRRIAVEAGPTRGWWKYVGFDGAVVGSKPAAGADSASLEAGAERVAEIALFLISTEG